MKASFLPTAVALATLASAAFAADPVPATKKADSAPAPAQPPMTTAPAAEASAQGAPTPTPPAGETVAATTPAPPPKDPTMLPQIEVNKSRITNLDIEINEKQRAIDREKQHTKPTRLDNALNNPKVSKALSIFGGSSSEDRAGLASERVKILQEEKEVLEAMKTAQTKEEKAELQQELDILRETRRELENTPK